MTIRTIDTGTDQLLCSVKNKVATITLNRPDKRNALSGELTPALRSMLLVLESDMEVGCIVITGAGKAFCAGGDLSGMGSGNTTKESSADNPRPTIEISIRKLQYQQETLTLCLHQLSKPTIAALPGPAAGAGMSIALSCDLRVAAADAFVTTAFANIGLSGDYGCSWFLTQLVGIAKAKELFYTGKRVYGEEGLALGIFNQICPFEDLAETTRSLAEQITAGPPIALGYMKQNLNRAVTEDLKSCLEMEADRMVRCMQTEDHKEAVRAFMEKRTPEFKGQ